MLNFPPSYFHKIISSSTSSPIFYLDLSNFKEEIRSTLRLNEDKIEVASPQARYRVKRWVYQSVIKIPKGHWQGYVVIEVDGTSEHAKDLLRRCGLHDPSVNLFPLVSSPSSFPLANQPKSTPLIRKNQPRGESLERRVGPASYGSGPFFSLE
jgi:hypothetical protein